MFSLQLRLPQTYVLNMHKNNKFSVEINVSHQLGALKILM